MTKTPKRLVTLVLTSFLLLAACSSASQEKPKEVKENTSSTTSTSSSKPIEKPASSDLDLSEMQQIGTDKVGYLYVPKDWIPFQDLSGGDTYQYTDVGRNIITMFSFTKEDIGVEQIDQKAVEQVANAYYQGMESSGNYEEVVGSMAEVSGQEAYQLYGYVKNDTKLICTWIFRTEKSDKVYQVSLEGDKETFEKLVPVIEASWTETK